MGYASFNLKCRAGNVNSRVNGFMLNLQGGSRQFNKPVGLKAARNFLKLLKGMDVQVERKSFSQLAVNYN
jgi:hypothetical protein